MASRGTAAVDIAVVGAGIGGLTFGLAMRGLGARVELFERAGELTEVGAAVALAANGARIMARLGLAGQIAAAAVTPTALIYRHGIDGRPIARAGDRYVERFGAPFWGIHRAQLQRILGRAWTEGDQGDTHLHLGRELVDMRADGDGVRLVFADGEPVRARLVIGADGVHSRVRRWVCPDTPTYSGTSGFRGLVPRAALAQLPDPDAIQFWLGPGAHLLHYPIGDLVNFLAVVDEPAQWRPPGGSTAAATGELAAHFAGWHPAVVEMITAVPQSPRWGLFALAPLTSWSRGPVVLLGDAAHAMLPHHGQGANQTIEDAAVLAGCLAGTEDHASAFRRYERLRRARTRQVQRSSWDASAALHLPDGPAAQARDRALPQVFDRFGWIHAHDADL